jgi:hypothetical protein
MPSCSALHIAQVPATWTLFLQLLLLLTSFCVDAILLHAAVLTRRVSWTCWWLLCQA